MALSVGAMIVFALFCVIISRYRKCPSDKILVIYGKVGNDKTGQARSAKCVHGGAAFIIPVIQSYQYMDLTPISMNVDLKNALSKQNIRIDVPSRFTVGISTEPGIMQNAAERLLGLRMPEIQELAKDIIFGQLRLVVATMDIEEINTDRDKFLKAVSDNVEIELKKIGLRLINVNVTDINDESGYIEALGKEAAAKAINDAKKTVAEKNRDGEIGQAEALRDQRIKVAEANASAIEGENETKIKVAQSAANLQLKETEARAAAENNAKKTVAERNRDGEIGIAEAMKDQRIKVSAANARSIEGENTAKIDIAQSDAARREREAESLKIAVAAEKVQSAKADEEAFAARQKAEIARAELERATRTADEIVKAEIEKQKIEISAEAEAEQRRRIAKGEADAIFAKMEAEAKGAMTVLANQAEGITEFIKAANGSPDQAVKLMIADKLEELMKIQVEAVKAIKIDKVTVWDGGAKGADGKTATADFLSGMMKSIPPLSDLFAQSGMDLPKYLGERMDGEETAGD
jgi:flotillin